MNLFAVITGLFHRSFEKSGMVNRSNDRNTSERQQAVLAAKAGDEHFVKKEYADALAFYDVAIQHGLESAKVFESRGHCLSSDFPLDAIDDFTKSISLDPINANAWFGRGMAKRGVGDFQGAVDDVRKARSLAEGRDPEAFSIYSTQLISIDNVEFWERQRQMRERNPEAWATLPPLLPDQLRAKAVRRHVAFVKSEQH